MKASTAEIWQDSFPRRKNRSGLQWSLYLGEVFRETQLQLTVILPARPAESI